jgi:protein disulfide-isomerase A6
MLHVLLASVGLVAALYTDNGPVIKLTASNFDKEVIRSDDLWLVEFYAPWCGHCKSLAPEWEKAAKALKGVVKVGAVDMTTDQQVGSPYNVQGFPTLKFFGESKRSPQDYNGGRTAKDIAEFAIEQAQSIVSKRLGGKKPSPKDSERSGNSGSKAGSEGSKAGSEGSKAGSEQDVVVLTDSNFEEQVINSKDMWLVEFYAPWCGHCQKLAPEWSKAATQLKGQVKVAKVDATVETSLAQKYGVKGYPTIKVFPPGEKGKAEDYNGPREASGIVSAALNKLEQYGIAPEIKQLTSPDVFKDQCEGGNVCLVTFLPHILDSSAAERTRYIDEIAKSAKKNRSKPITFMWVQGGDHFKFEEKLGLSFGYPAVLALSASRQMFSIMRSAFNAQELDSFVTSITTGTAALTPYSELPKLSTVPQWDGKDAAPEHEEL